jgi:uncharacterized protein (DUF2141 family)
MLKTLGTLGLAVLVSMTAAGPAQAALGPDASVCQSGNKPAVLVNVSGFKSHSGRIRVQLYRADSSFLQKGKWLRRVDLPVAGAGAMRVCLAAPAPGTYAVAVRHDTKANGSDWNDGGGFSRNPRLTLLNYKPNPSQVAIRVGSSVETVNVVLNYRHGLSIGPVEG